MTLIGDGIFIYLPVSHVNMCIQSDSTKTYRELFQTDVLACGVVKYVLLYIYTSFYSVCWLSERSFLSVNNLSDSKSERKPLLIEIICGREMRFDIRSTSDLKRVTEGDNVIGFHNFLRIFGRLGQSWTPVTQKMCFPCICIANKSALVCFLCSDSCRRTHVVCQQLFTKPWLLSNVVTQPLPGSSTKINSLFSWF